MHLRSELENLAPSVEPSPWRGYEHVRGYGVFGLPLSSGHTLALRVFPVNDFAPYVTVWLQTPDGAWTIFYDAPRPDIACPRYYGAAAEHVTPARIQLNWRSASELNVRVEQPQLDWTVWMKETPLLRALNGMSAHMPLWTWRYRPLLAPREWLAGKLGMGDVALSGMMPSGHYGILMPQRMYFIDRTLASLEGSDLGHSIRARRNPKIGDVALPARGIFAIGQAHWKILDANEYNATREAVKG